MKIDIFEEYKLKRAARSKRNGILRILVLILILLVIYMTLLSRLLPAKNEIKTNIESNTMQAETCNVSPKDGFLQNKDRNSKDKINQDKKYNNLENIVDASLKNDDGHQSSEQEDNNLSDKEDERVKDKPNKLKLPILEIEKSDGPNKSYPTDLPATPRLQDTDTASSSSGIGNGDFTFSPPVTGNTKGSNIKGGNIVKQNRETSSDMEPLSGVNSLPKNY
jgi:hypothetical protein